VDIITDIKETFKEGTLLTRLIYVNLAVFLLLKIVGLLFFLTGQYFGFLSWLAIPSDLHQLAGKPWTIITYMFTHEGFIHILFNLLGLYWFGKLFLYRLESSKLLGVYLLGGISGGLFYVVAYNIFPVFENANGWLIGASASVLAILVAIAFYTPDEEIHLSFIGTFKLKYVALFYVLLSAISISASNPGGNIAHLGGAAFGWFYIVQLKKGRDLGAGLVKLLDKIEIAIGYIFKPKNKLKIAYKQPPRDDHEYNRMKNNEQEVVNHILEKIAKTGYDSLTKSEKEILFKQGEK